MTESLIFWQNQTLIPEIYVWLPVKETVRSAESGDGVLISDDTAEEKQRTDENEIITWHHNHSRNRSVKGVNILKCLYHSLMLRRQFL